MLKEIEDLVSLQKIDNQLLKINSLRGDLPQTVESLEQDIEQLEKDTEEEKKREKEIILETKNLEGLIEDSKSRLNKYQDQLYLVTSNKEYDALTSEIDAMKREIDSSEYQILELAEEKDKITESYKSKEITHQEKLRDLQEKKSDLEKTDKQTSSIQNKLNKERKELLRHIPMRYIREYTRIANAKNGVAVVPVQQKFEVKKDKRGNIIDHIPSQVSCSGCQKIVPQQKVLEIRAGNKIIRCEFCGRVLYWDSEFSEIESHKEEEEIF